MPQNNPPWRGKLIGGPLDGQIRSLPADTMLDGDPREKGNPSFVIKVDQTDGVESHRSIYARRAYLDDDGVWKYFWIPASPSEPIIKDNDE